MIVVSLINMKGGVAKTTMAINIADCLASRHGERVLLIDVDPQFNATQCLMSPEDYIAHVAGDGDTILKVFDRSQRVIPSAVANPQQAKPKKLEDIEIVNVKQNFDLLPGNLELYRLEMAPGDGRENRLKNYLQKVQNDYDYVVIDTPPTPSVWMTSALIASDFYLIPVKADPISLTGIDLLRSIIEEKKDNFGLNLECAGLVLTLTEANTKVFQRAKENLENDQYWRRYLYPVSLPKRVGIAQGQLEQMHILSGDNSEAKIAITGITTEFTNRVEENE
ncbi:ParA family protein [Microbulbifer sp. SSSA005]|uniref:ParA family protein n=1 Tax=Microbulbifer sp. SSSA005 TaxID=3243378 RepID=UPI0040391C8A